MGAVGSKEREKDSEENPSEERIRLKKLNFVSIGATSFITLVGRKGKYIVKFQFSSPSNLNIVLIHLKRWDEWVGVDRLMKYTEENSWKLSRDMKHVADKFAKSGQPSDTKLDTCFSSRRKQTNNSSVICRKRKREQFEVTGKDNAAVGKQVNMSISPTLKKQLMDDFEFINKMGKLVKLPRTPNVDDILDKYRDCRGKKESVISASVGEVLSGIRVYFNKALPVMLLYNKERQQYQEAIADNVSPSGVYGAEHLLRLFVKLPNLLDNLRIDEQTLGELQQNLHDILKFLQKNQSLFFLSTYFVPEASGRNSSKDDD